jgi:hypothetical protein
MQLGDIDQFPICRVPKYQRFTIPRNPLKKYVILRCWRGTIKMGANGYATYLIVQEQSAWTIVGCKKLGPHHDDGGIDQHLCLRQRI